DSPIWGMTISVGIIPFHAHRRATPGTRNPTLYICGRGFPVATPVSTLGGGGVLPLPDPGRRAQPRLTFSSNPAPQEAVSEGAKGTRLLSTCPVRSKPCSRRASRCSGFRCARRSRCATRDHPAAPGSVAEEEDRRTFRAGWACCRGHRGNRH